MSPVVIGIIGLIIMFVLLATGLPIGFGMLLVSTIGLLYLLSGSVGIIKLATTPFYVAMSYDLCALPAFLLMANIILAAGFGTDLFTLASKWLGHLRGGLAMATVGGCAGFAAISASSLATAVTMGLVAVPEMRRYNYNTALATGCLAAGGGLGILIPPSGILILYGILTETSISRLFAGGIIPGILQALFYMATIYIICLWRPSYGPQGHKTSFREKIVALGSCGELIVLIILILGGLIVGWFTPTESASVGVVGAIVLSLVRRQLDWPKFKQAIFDTVKTTGMLYFIIIGAYVFKYFIALSTLPFVLANFVGGLDLPPIGVMGIIILIYIGLGCFMEAGSMVLLTIPIFFPLAVELGFSPIWFGIILVTVMEIATITPPMGMNVFTIAGMFPDVPVQTIFKGVLPFIVAAIFHVLLLLLVPALVMFLPNLM